MHQVPQELKVDLVPLETKEILVLQVLQGQLDQLVVMERQGLMEGMEIKGNKELLVLRDQE